MQYLDAYLDDELVGRFSKDANDEIHFEYLNSESPQISLSLPNNQAWPKNAPSRFLNNLLPEHPLVRQNMVRALGAKSTETFDLLEVVGDDIAGGLILVPPDVSPTEYPERLRPASTDDIAFRIDQLKLNPDSWYDSDVKPRFSLAGAQPKFALAMLEGNWYWSSKTHPSAHILKPESVETPFAQQIEVATMALSRAVGIETPDAFEETFFDQSVYR